MGRRMDALIAEQLTRCGDHQGAAIVLARSAPKEGARVLAGHKAQAFGDGWEKWLTGQHKAARLAGLAYLRHVGPPHRRTGPGGREIKIVGVGPADFQGAIRPEDDHCPWWRLLAVEAKSVQDRLQRDDLEPHQRDDLAWVESVGGVALVVLELHDVGGLSLGTWALPWSDLEVAWSRSSRVMDRGLRTERVVESASVGPAELVGYEVAPQGIYLERFAGGEG